jgi:hypothetical protein
MIARHDNVAKYCQMLSTIANILTGQYCKILPSIVKYCQYFDGQILPNIAEILTKQYCQILPRYCVIAKYCQIIGIPEPPVYRIDGIIAQGLIIQTYLPNPWSHHFSQPRMQQTALG